MEDLDIQIKKLQETVYVLLKRYKHVQKENELLKNVNEKLENHIKQKDVLLNNAQQKSVAENLASMQNDDEKKILQQRVDYYLKDIDKCLSFLSA